MIVTDFDVAVVENDSHLSKWIVEQKTLAVADGFCRLFKQYIPEGGTVVDVGASLGDHTVTYSDMVGNAGIVHAFEPNPVAFECLRYNMRKRQNVVIYPIALGSYEAFGSVVENDNLGAAQVVLSTVGAILVKPLDLIGRHWTRLDFVKIDAEGFEPDIIQGARATLRRLRPALLVEINRPVLAARQLSPDDILRPLAELGYRVEPCDPKLTMDLEMVDVICVPK